MVAFPNVVMITADLRDHAAFRHFPALVDGLHQAGDESWFTTPFSDEIVYATEIMKTEYVRLLGIHLDQEVLRLSAVGFIQANPLIMFNQDQIAALANVPQRLDDLEDMVADSGETLRVTRAEARIDRVRAWNIENSPENGRLKAMPKLAGALLAPPLRFRTKTDLMRKSYHRKTLICQFYGIDMADLETDRRKAHAILDFVEHKEALQTRRKRRVQRTNGCQCQAR